LGPAAPRRVHEEDDSGDRGGRALIEGAPREVALLGLETSRIGGLLLAAPLPWVMAPARIRAALAILLAFVVHNIVPAGPIQSVWELAAAVPNELLAGAAMGFVVRLALSAVEVAGETLGPVIGLGTASLFDPHINASETAIARLLRFGGMLLALAIGLHRTVLGALLESFRVLPVGSSINPAVSTLALVQMSGAAIAEGVIIAMPVIGVILMVQLALAFVSRAAPSMQIFSIGFAVTLLVGVATLVMSLPDFADEIAEEVSAVGRRLETIVSLLVRG
jgi:flagellar biosynthetic protein FliR